MITQVRETTVPSTRPTRPAAVERRREVRLPVERLLALQRQAGNRAVLRGLTAQRCGAVPPEQCSCHDESRAAAAETESVQRTVTGDVRAQSITPAWARALSDGELVEQTGIVRAQLQGLAPGDSQRAGAEGNLQLLTAESERRVAAQAMGGLRLGGYQPKPPGTPDDGWAAVQLPDIPASVLQVLPEGQPIEIDARALYGRIPMPAGGPNSSFATPGPASMTETAGAGAGGGVLASSVNMRMWGYPGGAQGQYSVGIIVRPRANALDWGHTSLTLRRGSQPVDVVGFNPDMRTRQGLLDLARHHREVEAGTRAVRGRFTSDSSMFTANDPVHVEWVISEAEAAQFAMAKPGLAPQLDYVARPAVYRPPAGACSGSNCGLWAIGEIESQLGTTVGRVGDPAGITSMGRGRPPTPMRGSQPAIVDMAQAGARDPAVISPLRPGGPPPVVSTMPRLVRVVRVGGTVLLVIGLVAGAVEVVTARPEERARTAVGVTGGFVGGLALGATAGLICGPGAPVCSLVFGLGLGTLGAIGGRWASEQIFDVLTAQPAPRPGPSGATTSGTRGQDPREGWEMLFTPPAPAPALLFVDVSARTPLVRTATPLDVAFAGP